MAKTRRGRPLRSQGQNRGACPLCGRTGVKLLFETKLGGQTAHVCKQCKTVAARRAAAEEAAAKAAQPEPAPATEDAPADEADKAEE